MKNNGHWESPSKSPRRILQFPICFLPAFGFAMPATGNANSPASAVPHLNQTPIITRTSTPTLTATRSRSRTKAHAWPQCRPYLGFTCHCFPGHVARVSCVANAFIWMLMHFPIKSQMKIFLLADPFFLFWNEHIVRPIHSYPRGGHFESPPDCSARAAYGIIAPVSALRDWQIAGSSPGPQARDDTHERQTIGFFNQIT